MYQYIQIKMCAVHYLITQQVQLREALCVPHKDNFPVKQEADPFMPFANVLFTGILHSIDILNKHLFAI
jgi:hypothetical protein